jgi:hypothetical protein
MIRTVSVPRLCGDEVRFFDATMAPEEARKALFDLCFSMAVDLLPTVDLDSAVAVEQSEHVEPQFGTAVGGD